MAGHKDHKELRSGTFEVYVFSVAKYPFLFFC